MKVGVCLTWDTEKCLFSVLSGLILEKIYELFVMSSETVGYIYMGAVRVHAQIYTSVG